jgi:tetratricopeptide (TPR) repeat protein
MMKYLVLISFAALTLAGCGAPARKALPEVVPDKALGHEKYLAEYQAFDHFSKADLFEEIGNYEKAADEYRLALVFNPGSDALKRYLANVYYIMRRYDEALDLILKIDEPEIDDIVIIANCYALTNNNKMAKKYFERASEIDSTLELPNQFLTGYYSDRHDYKKAEYYYRRYLGSDTTADRWQLKIAAYYRDTRQTDKAALIYRRMIESDSTKNSGYLGLASIKEMQNDSAGADSIYKIIAHDNWDDAQVLAIISQSFIRLNDLPAAIEITRRICVLYPDDYLTKRRLSLMLFSAGDYKASDSVLAALSQVVTDDAIIFYYRGRIAQLDSNFSAATGFFSSAVAINDTLSEAWAGLAFSRAALADTSAAMATFDSALATRSSDSTRILFFTGVFLSQSKKYSAASGYFDRVLRADPKNTNALFGLGAACERDGRFEDAEKAFERLLRIQPDNAPALNYLGFMWADKGIKLDESETMIKKALKIEPENGAYLDSYAWVLYKKGKYKEALKFQEKAMQFSPDDAALFDHLGDIQAALKDFGRAHDNWQKALQLDPSNETIKQKLAK